MDISTFMIVSALWLIVICSLVCAIYMILLLSEGYVAYEQKIQKGALVFFLMFAGVFFAGLLYKWFPELYVTFIPLICVCLSCSWIAFYYVVFTLTTKGKNKRFPRIHIILPLILPVVLTIWMPFVPFEVPLGIVKGFRTMNADWPVFSRVCTSLLYAFVVFAGGYLTLSLVRFRRYRRSLSKKKREDARYQMRWINTTLLLIGTAWALCITAVIISPRAIYSTYGFILSAAIAIGVMEIVLLYNLQQHNYPPLDIKTYSRPDKLPVEIPLLPAGEEKASVTPFDNVKLTQLSRKDFDRYFRQEKLYLNPELKLTSLAKILGVNRDDLSKFINRTYQVNFNVFINRWRFEEVERLRKLNKNKGVSLKLLLPQAGFASYNSYMRAKQQAQGKKKDDSVE